MFPPVLLKDDLKACENVSQNPRKYVGLWKSYNASHKNSPSPYRAQKKKARISIIYRIRKGSRKAAVQEVEPP
jgi:hypothetical protein